MFQKSDLMPGDLFMVDSNKGGPKIVKFFQAAPTVWQHLWRKIRKTQEKVLYYHVGMFMNKDYIIEQQGKVEIKDSTKLLNTQNSLLIVRFRGPTYENRLRCVNLAQSSIEQGYDILNIFGKLLTWLTGIKLFARYIEWPKAEICINRVAYWWKNGFGETFGAKKHSELTTHLMYKYIKAHPEKFQIIYEKLN